MVWSGLGYVQSGDVRAIIASGLSCVDGELAPWCKFVDTGTAQNMVMKRDAPVRFIVRHR